MVNPFARRNRYRHASAQGGERFVQFRKERLLEPKDLERLQGFRNPQRAFHVEPPVALDHQIDRIAHGLAHRRHATNRFGQFATGDIAIETAEGVPLQSLPAAGDGLAGFRGELIRRFRRHEPGVGVASHSVAALPAQQLPHRLAQQLALDVPAGHLQTGQGTGQHGAHAPVGVAIEVVAERFDVQRAAPQQRGREVVDHAHDRVFVQPDGRFAVAVQAFVGLDFHEGQVGPIHVAEPSFDGGDSHGRLLLLMADQYDSTKRPPLTKMVSPVMKPA